MLAQLVLNQPVMAADLVWTVFVQAYGIRNELLKWQDGFHVVFDLLHFGII